MSEVEGTYVRYWLVVVLPTTYVRRPTTRSYEI